MRHVLRRELEELAQEQQSPPVPMPAACSWLMVDRATRVELCWNPQLVQRLVGGEGGFGYLLGIATETSPRSMQIWRAVQTAGVRREDSALQALGADVKLLADSLVCTSERPWARVLGYYRTVPGGSADFLRPTPEDERAIQRCCSMAPGLVLLLQGQGERARGALYLWDEAGLDYTSPMFFSPAPVAGPSVSVLTGGAAAAVAPGLAIPAPVVSTGSKSAAGQSNSKQLITGIVYGMILAMTVMAAYFVWHAKTGQPNPTAVLQLPALGSERAEESASLRAEAINGLLRIRWNPSSPAILSSDSGYLSIQDGNELKTIPLSGDQLRSGLMLYQPANQNLTIGLTGMRSGRSVIQSAVAIGPPSAVAIPAAVSARLPAVNQPPADVAPAAVPERDPLPEAATSFRLSPPQLTREEPVAPPSMTTVAPPTRPASELLRPDRPEPARPSAKAAAPTPVQASLNVPGELYPTSQAPPTTQRLARPDQTPGGFTPARPHALIVPRSDHYRRMLIQSVTIAVTLQIDATGRVTKATADTSKSFAGALAALAIASAKSSSFEPARQDGVPVASELVVLFKFEKR